MAGASRAEAMVEAVFRKEWGRIVASLIAMTDDWNLAEECAQDAFTRARRRGTRRRVGPPRRLVHHGSPLPRHRRAAPPSE
jgi:RNA polymerase sigma-70 factor, ECF subfamily